MAEAKVFVNRPPSSSSPPNCAICLGSCANKCFSDSCMHEFCFKCLLQWSKIKAECPLCKQPFKRIIHNVKSNEEYEEHVVETQRTDDFINLLDNHIVPDEFFIVPPHPNRHEFHVRTTFTVDSRGEQAVQHMLLTHPLMTGGRITIGANYHHQGSTGRPVFPSRHRPRDFSATSFRRSIYAQDLWVNALPDFSGRYRDVTPQFFRENPAARTRLVPWLNRELNALLYENTQLIMHLVDRIMETLLEHHICSRYFRNMLEEYLATKTDHFVHEFYSFMRSPFDMVGYDRNVIYTPRPQSPAPFLEDETVEVATSDDDSDVIIVGSSNPAQPVTISLVETDSDEPELVSQTDQLPMPILPIAKREDSPCGARPFSPVLPVQLPVVNLPPKLRHKHIKQLIQDNEKHKEKRKRRLRSPSNSSSSSSSSTSSTENARSNRSDHYRRRQRQRLRKKQKKNVINSSDSTESTSDTEVNVTSEEDKPLIDVLKKKWKSRSERDKRRKSRSEPSTSKSKISTHSNESSRTNTADSSTRTSSRTNESSPENTCYNIIRKDKKLKKCIDKETGQIVAPSVVQTCQNGFFGEPTSNVESRSPHSSQRTHGHSSTADSRIFSSWNNSELPSSSSQFDFAQPSTSRSVAFDSRVPYLNTSFNMPGLEKSSHGVGYRGMMNGSEPMDLSVPVSLPLISGMYTPRLPESTTPPLPPNCSVIVNGYHRSEENGYNTDNAEVCPSLTPPLRASCPRSSSSGSTTEDCLLSTYARTDLKQEEESNPGSSKPLVLRKNTNNKWYVWTDTDEE